MRTYLAMFILRNSLNEETQQKTVQRIRDAIGKIGGETVKTEMLGRRGFARPVRKQDSGFYVRVEFRAAPDHVGSLKAPLKLVEEILRTEILLAPAKRPVAAPAAAEPRGQEESGDGGKS